MNNDEIIKKFEMLKTVGIDIIIKCMLGNKDVENEIKTNAISNALFRILRQTIIRNIELEYDIMRLKEEREN